MAQLFGRKALDRLCTAEVSGYSLKQKCDCRQPLLAIDHK